LYIKLRDTNTATAHIAPKINSDERGILGVAGWWPSAKLLRIPLGGAFGVGEAEPSDSCESKRCLYAGTEPFGDPPPIRIIISLPGRPRLGDGSS